MDFQYIIFVLLFLWFIHILHRMLYVVYFWQVKEYRLDRMKGDLKKTLNVLFPKTAILSLLVLIILPIFLAKHNVSVWDSIVLFVFCLFGLYSLALLAKKSWRIPKFTKKASVLAILSIISLVLFFFVSTSRFFIFIVLAEIIFPLITLVLAEILQIPTFFIKNAIYKKAQKKIKQMKGLTVIGITGSYGKSSTKEFIYAFLSKKFNVLKTCGNINTEIGVAQTIIDQLKPEHQIFIAEMGAYRKGEIKMLCNIVNPKFGIITGVNEQHLALFGSLDNLLSAEGGRELAEFLPKNGALFVNGDNKFCLDLYKRADNFPVANKKIYSISNRAIDSDIWAEELEVAKDYVSFVAINKKGEVGHFRANVLGKQNVQNLLGAILLARELGMTFAEISEACKDISNTQAGMVLKKGKHEIDIVDSSYSANPDGVYADLDYFSMYENKKVIVMPCLIELGEKSSEIHDIIGKKIAGICDLAIITTKDKFTELKQGAVDAGMSPKNILLCDNASAAYAAITLFCKSGDAVLLEGRVPAGLANLLIEEK